MATSAVGAPAAVYDNTTAGHLERVASRIVSLDFVRGLVMVLMAIDHVRVYSGLPAGGPTPGIFFTRWITHFVAPAFVFLAGTAAYLHGRKLPSRAALARFLVTRGAFLILLELTVIRLAWTFNVDFASYLLAGVIWMIGWCMILLAAAIFLPTAAIATIGIAIVALHNLTNVFPGAIGQAFGDAGPGWLLTILYFGWGPIQLGSNGPPLFVLFVIVPWIGVMMSGYAFGHVMQMSPERRREVCLKLGVALTVLFVGLRALNVYGDPRPWDGSQMPAVLSFLNTSKYPASLLFLLMTLGPMLILLGLAERWGGRPVEVTATFGRVPMFYYLLHIPLIHAAACLVSLAREGRINPWLFGNHPLAPPPVPAGYVWSLTLLYVVFVASVIALYFPCHWYARLRATRRYPWLSYL
ncbi:MAG: DUF1624 domain-containing protein [Gemmatimonadaceae bacterium]